MIAPPKNVPIFGTSCKMINPSIVESKGVTNMKFVTSLVRSAKDIALPHKKYAAALGNAPKYIKAKICVASDVINCCMPCTDQKPSKIAPQIILQVTISKAL